MLRIRRMTFWAMVTAMTICSAGCSPSTKEVNWKEETRLANGSIIVVERTQTYRRVSEPGAGSGWLFDHAEITAQPPGQSASIRWEGAVQPLVLDQDGKGIIHLLCAVASYRGERTYGVPEGTWYVAFRFENGAWSRILLDQFPRGLKPNLLASIHRAFLNEQKQSGTLVDIALKTKLDSDRTLAEHYRTLINLK